MSCADETQAAVVDAAARERGAASGDRRIVAFCCRECAYAAADATGNARISLPPTIRSVLVPCTGRVSPLHLLRALAEGADGVYVAGCLEGQCHYREGNFHASTGWRSCSGCSSRSASSRERCQMFTMSAAEPPKFVAAAREMDKAIGELPPLERSGGGESAFAAAAATAPAAVEEVA